VRGWVRFEFLTLGHRNYKVIPLTHKSRNLLEQRGREVDRGRTGNIEHRYWQEQWHRKMKKEHPGCDVVSPVGGGGAIDVAVLEADGSAKIAVEIEISSLDRALRNISKDKAAGFGRTIVVEKKNILQGIRLEDLEKVEI
jgi:hypothetical protein